MKPKISIIVLNWNGVADTSECIASLREIDYKNYEVIIVDNNSSGNDVDIIKEKYGDYVKEVIVNDDNYGFAGGNNVGIKYALNGDADLILLLNNDTIVEKNFLNELVAALNSDKDIGILTPMINYYSNKDTIWSAGGYISKIKASGFSSGTDMQQDSFVKNEFCSFASGCCLLIKREVFERIGLLDDKYFLYLEDTDFCYRTISAGFKVMYVSSSKIYHKVSSTTSRVFSSLPIYFSTRNRLYFAKKNLGLFFYISFIYLVITMAIKMAFVFKFNEEILKTVLSSFRDYFSKNMNKGSMIQHIG
ncbi:MAG: glycosyltransferase family 2 protein [Bacteroidetes bacterium]|nr:glycosyltransferase family 2 protein [Bacteroidota bacterium]